MRVHICAVGRLRAGPEKTLIDDYLKRFDKVGRGLGLSLGQVIEVEDRKGGGMAAEAALIRKALPGAVFWVMDERGEVMTSPVFADRLGAQLASRNCENRPPCAHRKARPHADRHPRAVLSWRRPHQSDASTTRGGPIDGLDHLTPEQAAALAPPARPKSQS